MEIAKPDMGEPTTKRVVKRKRPETPYPGLRAFEGHEARIFFGRDRHIDEILERLAESHFVPVIGPSGCGKSSLIRAGVVPALRAGRYYDAGSRWNIAVMRPENSPIWNLALVLSGLTRKEDEDVDYDNIRQLVSMLLGDDDGIEQFHKQSGLRDDENILLVVDQFEELFNIENEAQLDAAEALISIILNIHEAKFERIHCIITMRTDNLGDCARFTGLADAINRTLYLTPNLTELELREAVELPAVRFGGVLEEGLLDRLLNDMKQEIDQLPLMQHIMWRIWTTLEGKKRDERILSHELYESFGCIADTVNLHAKELVENLDSEQKKLVSVLFRRLTERRVGGVHQDVRRPTLFKDIALISDLQTEEEKTLLRSVVNHFRAPLALFLRPQEREHARIEDETNIDIVHECLIRKWDDLKDWVEQEWKSARDLRDLDRQAARFEKMADAESESGQGDPRGKQDASVSGEEEGWAAFLWRVLGRKQAYLDRHLTAELSRWLRKEKPNEAWARGYGFSAVRFQRAIEFLEFSKKTHRLHKLAKSTALTIGFFAIALGSISSWYATKEDRINSISRATSKLGLTAQMLSPNMTRSALKIWSEELHSGEGELEKFATDNPELKPWVSAQRAMQEENLSLMLIPEAAESHAGVFTHERGFRSLLFESKPVLSIENSPDGRNWAVLYEGGLSLIDRSGKKIKNSNWKFLTPRAGPPELAPVITFHPDGKHIFIIFGDRRLWKIDLHNPDGVSHQNLTGDIGITAISADGSRLAIAREITNEDPTSTEQTKRHGPSDPSGHKDGDIDFWEDPDIRYHVEIIDLLTSKPIASFKTIEPMGKLTAISYDADDHTLLALAFEQSFTSQGQPSKPLTLWRIPDEGEPELRPIIDIRTPVTGIKRIELSPDGKWIAAQTSIIGHLWNLFDIPESKGPNWSLYGYSLPIQKLKFLRNGEILTMRRNGETHVWRYEGMLSSRKLINGPLAPQHVTLDINKSRLGVIDGDGNFLHWNLKDQMSSQAEVLQLNNYAKYVTVSGDGSVVAVGYQNGELELLAPRIDENGRIALPPYTLAGTLDDIPEPDSSPLITLAVSKDGGVVAALRQNGVLITAIRNSSDVNTYDLTTSLIEGVTKTSQLLLSISPDGKQLVVLVDGRLNDFTLSLDGHKAAWLEGGNRANPAYSVPICAIAFSSDGGHISAGTDDGKVLVAQLADGKLRKSWKEIRSFANNSVSSVSFGLSAGQPIIAAVLRERSKTTPQCGKGLRQRDVQRSGVDNQAQNRNVELAVSLLDGTAIPERSKKMSMETRTLKYRGTSFLPDGDTILLTDVNARGNAAIIRFFDLFPARVTSTEILETLRGQIHTRDYIDPRGSFTNEKSGAKFDEYFPARTGCGRICWMIAPTGIKNRLLVVAFQNLKHVTSGESN